MRYRPLDQNGDYTVGIAFLADSPACVAQAIQTRLGLWQGTWFLDTSDGTPYLPPPLGSSPSILGPRANASPDALLKQRILGTPDVTAIVTYSSSYAPVTRVLTVSGTVQTEYSTTPVPFSSSLALQQPI